MTLAEPRVIDGDIYGEAVFTRINAITEQNQGTRTLVSQAAVGFGVSADHLQ